MSAKAYVVAVSGGVDSVALLDMFVKKQPAGTDIIVAHVDHGIREDSSKDADLVRGLAKNYGLPFESTSLKLGAEASEALARQERYIFLRQCCKKHNAQLVTAHHQDDVLETMLINLIRGTGWRGLVSLDSEEILRPLLSTPKSELIAYAKEHSLQWREDSTNSNQRYLRNYVRLNLLPRMHSKDSETAAKLLAVNQRVMELKKDIATELQNILAESNKEVSTHHLIMWPEAVAREILYSVLTKLDPNWHPSKLQLQRALHFVKSARIGQQIVISKHLKLIRKRAAVQFKKY
jgi:tRNA(Ile)-lysidine synthetase-like protein